MQRILPEPTNPVYLSPDSLEWALNHAISFGDTVFLPNAFEYNAILFEWTSIKDWLLNQDMVKWQPRPLRRFLATKNRYSFRYVTQLDPLEYLAFTALLYVVGPNLEALRVPQNKKIVHSWRFKAKTNGQMYDPNSEWSQFNEQCLELANGRDVKWVVVADIADFFPHIYIHPVERVLARAAGCSPEAYCIMRMIRNWNAFVSYGLPVGIAGSRIIAEATINDIDQMLIDSGRQYCRYADDFRIFCKSEREAYETLEELGSGLFEMHGLTLQPQKTDILNSQEYINRFSISPERIEAESLTDKFKELLEEAGIEDDYDADIGYDDLPEHIRDQIDQLNLVWLFQEQIKMDRSDPIIMRILLHRMGQLNIDAAVHDLLNDLGKLGHIIDAVVRYLNQLRGISQIESHQIGKRVLEASQSESTTIYQRVCLLSLFTNSHEFDNEDEFVQLYRKFNDIPTKRKLILAMGRAGKEHWFMHHRRDYAAFEPWTRRAFIAAFSCVSIDAREPFYRSLRGGNDVLEKAVIKWASANPFS